MNPNPGHGLTATRNNMCGGSTTNQHKVVYIGYNYVCACAIITIDFDDDKKIVSSN